MDGLNEAERALAWAASWNPSFDGIAIVNKDFTFRSVNSQFCILLGASPAELLGQRFQDITPPEIRRIDEANAKLVMTGAIDSYLLPKSFNFGNGKIAHVVLLVKGVYSPSKEFLFFISRIMKDETKQVDLFHSPSPKPTGLLVFLIENKKVFLSIGAVIGTIIYTVIEQLMKKNLL
jgi:PAS domain S-box-containing protein